MMIQHGLSSEQIFWLRALWVSRDLPMMPSIFIASTATTETRDRRRKKRGPRPSQHTPSIPHKSDLLHFLAAQSI